MFLPHDGKPVAIGSLLLVLVAFTLLLIVSYWPRWSMFTPWASSLSNLRATFPTIMSRGKDRLRAPLQQPMQRPGKYPCNVPRPPTNADQPNKRSVPPKGNRK